MNSLEELLNAPGVHRLGWGLIHFLWEGAVIALLLSAALVLLRRRSANIRYLTAFATLILMVVSLPVTFGLVPDTLLFQSPETKTEIEEPRQEALSAQFSGEKHQQSPNEENSHPLSEDGNIHSSSPQVWAPIPAEKTDPSVVSPTVISPASTLPDNPLRTRLLRIVQAALPWTVFLWLVGITLLSLFHLGGWLSLRRLCAGSRPVPAFVQQQFQQLMTRMQMSRSVRLLESARVVVPSLIGLFRPVILLPGSALTGLTTKQLEAVLAHELAHIRRHDYLLNLLQTAMETLLFYHPAVWWVGKVIRKERENCCDDLALKVCEDRVLYARALAELAGLNDTPRLAVTMNSPKGELLPRIQRVLGLTSPDPSRSGSWLVVGMGILLTAGMIFGCLAAQDGTLEQKTQTAETKETWRVLPDVGLGQMSNICFVDEARGWLAFSDGSLLTTTDVGKTWHSVPLPDSGGSRGRLLVQLLKRLNGSSFGWAISDTGKIFHTSDGLTWEQQKPPLENVKNRISCLDVLDENHAWISGYGMTWRTTNGGRSWESIQFGLRGEEPHPSGFSAAEEHRFIHFRDKNDGTALVVTDFGWKTRTTTDGGKTWHTEQDTIPIPYKNNSVKTILRSGRAVRVYSDGGLLIYGHGDLPIDDTMSSQLLARKSVSAGYRIVSNSDRYYSIVSKDSIAAFEKIHRNSSDSTSLHFTRNGGKQWSQHFLATHLSSVHFVDQIHGWAVGPAGRVSHTLDGGETWVHTFLPTDADFYTVYFLDEKTGWLGGGFSTHGAYGQTAPGKGCVWRTMDGGDTWERVSQIENGRTGEHSHPETIRGLVFKNRDDGWAVTHGMTKKPQKEINGSTPLEYGRILHTDNGGTTWTQVYYGAPLKDIALRDNRWCSAGYRIVHSEDGIKWENAAPGNLVNGVAFADGLNVFAVGERSAVGHSSTAGAQWSWTRPFKQSLLSAVSFGSPKIGWVAGYASADGEDHGLFVTSDGGKTWQAAQINWPVGYSTIRHNWQDICAVDSQHAWAVGTSYGQDVILRLGSGNTSRASARSNTPKLSASLKHLESVAWTNSGRHHTATLKLKSDYTYELKETQRYEKEITTTLKGKWSVLSQPLALIALDGKHLIGKHGVRIFQTNANTTKGHYERVALRQQRLHADDRPAEWLEVAKDRYALLPHLAKHTSEVMVVPLPKPEVETIDLEGLMVPDSIQRQVSPLVQDGWRSEVLSNAVLVTRNKKAETYGTFNLPEHSGVADLRKMNMTIDQRYVITLRVGPKVSLEDYRKKKVENAETYKQLASLREKMQQIQHKFDSYLPSTLEEKKLVEQYEKLKKSRHDLPDGYSETHSIWISESVGWGEAFADEAVGKECRKVHGKLVDLFRSYEPSDKTKAAVEELKATLDTLTVDLVFRGKTHNYNDSLTLLGPKAEARDTDRLKLMLTTSDLSKIVQALADSGFFDRAKDVRRKTSLTISNETVYTLTLRTVAGGPYWREQLQLEPTLFERLDALRNTLTGDAAKEMDKLLALLEPQRKKWEKKSAANDAPKSPQNSLQVRTTAPAQIEQGMPLAVKLDLRSDPMKLAADIKRLNTFLHDAFLELRLTNRNTGKTVTIKPYDPTSGMPILDEGKFVEPLDGTPLKPWRVKFPLADVYDSLPPGDYECLVQFSFPKKRTSWWRGDDAKWREAGFWHGTVSSASFRLTVRKQLPKTRILLLPKRLRVEKVLEALREEDPNKTAVPVVRFRKIDAEEVRLPIRNGHFIAAKCSRDGEFYKLTAPPKPDDVNHIDMWTDYKEGDRKVSYTIEVFETADRPEHGWGPGPGSGGYKVLWKKTFEVVLTQAEFGKKRAVVRKAFQQRLKNNTSEKTSERDTNARVHLTEISDDHMAAVKEIEKLGGKVSREQLETGEVYSSVKLENYQGAEVIRRAKRWFPKLDNLRDVFLWNSLKPVEEELRELADVSQLRSLRFRYCRFSEKGLELLGEYGKLERLTIYNCFLENGQLDFLKRLPQLQSLTVNNKNISAESLGPLMQLPNLERLELSGFPMTNDKLNYLDNCRKLRVLHFEGYQCESVLVRMMDAGVFDQLREFRPGLMKLTDVFLSRIPRWKHLKVAVLLVPEPGEGSLSPLQKLTQLEVLVLEVRDASVKSISPVGGIGSLRSLAVSHNGRERRPDGTLLRHLTDLKRLETLKLGVSPIQREESKHLAVFSRLRDLNISSMVLDKTALMHLETIPNLKRLGIHSIDIAETTSDDWKGLKQLESVGVGGDVPEETLLMLVNFPSLKKIAYFSKGSGTLSEDAKRKLKDVEITLYD